MSQVYFFLQVIPSRDGQLLVTVYDLCIATGQPAQVTITVSGVGSVQLYVMDKVIICLELPNYLKKHL